MTIADVGSQGLAAVCSLTAHEFGLCRLGGGDTMNRRELIAMLRDLINIIERDEPKAPDGHYIVRLERIITKEGDS